MDAALIRRLSVLEAESAIRRVLARYMDLCDVPRAPFEPAKLGALFSEDAIWEGIGAQYAAKFGRQHGRAQITDFVMAYLPPSAHFHTNLHFLTSESIQVNGERAEGQWIMQQLSTYEDGRSELISARLNITFEQIDGQWLMAHFRTQRLFDAPLRRAQA